MRTLILVDDEPIILEHTRGLLDWAQMNMKIIGHAHSGAEGIRLVRQLEPDAVITDLVMPGMNGLEMIQQLEGQTKTRFIVLTGYKEFEYVQTALRSGVVDYILKPATAQELKSALTRLFGDQEEEPDYEQLYGAVVAKVIAHVNEQLTDPELTLQWICKNRLFMNETYVGRLFQQRLGVKFNTYLTGRRIEFAKALLAASPDLPVSELAESSGFVSAKYFIEVFKKQVGITPGQYTRNH